MSTENNKLQLLESKNCIICNSNQAKVIYTWPAEFYSHQIYETCSWDARQKVPLTIVRCEQCGLVYTKPSFKEEYLHLIYPEETVQPDLDKFFDLDNLKINSILKIVSEYIHHGDTLLDIGTRYGALPYLAEKKYGLMAYGLEYNQQSVLVGKQRFNNIVQGVIKDLPQILKQYNISNFKAVVMDDILEHLINPDHDLKIISNIQDEGDYLFLRQMDIDSLGRRIFRKNWYYFQPAAHMFYFNQKSVQDLLNKHGYKIIKVYHQKILTRNILRTVKNTLKKFIKSFFNHKLKIIERNLVNNKKPQYLVNRNRLFNDRFLVVAQKQ